MDEPNDLIRWTIFVFAGGDAGIWGALSIATVVMLSFRPGLARPIRPLYVGGVVAFGLIFVACGSTPMPAWFQLTTLLWLVLALSKLWVRTFGVSPSADLPTVTKVSTSHFILFLSPFVWLLTAIAIELPFHLWFAPAEHVSKLLVIGDSVTAGLNDGENTWPRQLSRAAAVEVLDASQPGATLQSARQQNSRLSDEIGLVVLEIGGNDMLEGLAVTRFEDDLDHLLAEVTQSGRSAVMFELPLPPFCAAYGAAQRRQAKRHRVHLIPKRLFAKVLTTRGATVDGIHLSERGQSQMMELIQMLLGDRLRPGKGTFQRFE